jgi:hypothetical protein
MRRTESVSINSYSAFWLFYLREHSDPSTRRWHVTGTLVALALVVAATVSLNPWLLLAALFAGYGPAFASHFLFEKNRPATLRGHPLWSLVSDIRMTFTWLGGGLHHELRKAGIETPERN